MRMPREITMRTWLEWTRSKTSVPLRIRSRLSDTWLGTIQQTPLRCGQGETISTRNAIYDEQTSEKPFDYGMI